METVNHKIRRLIRYYEHNRQPGSCYYCTVRRDPDRSITVRQYFDYKLLKENVGFL